MLSGVRLKDHVTSGLTCVQLQVRRDVASQAQVLAFSYRHIPWPQPLGELENQKQGH